jgi:hypothetical protein
MGVFDDYDKELYDIRYAVTLAVGNLHGGIPQNPDIIEGWIRSKMEDSTDDLINQMVFRTLEDLGLDLEQENYDAAIAEMRKRKTNGFYRTHNEELAVAGRHIKAMLKENASIQWPKRKWGPTNKGTINFIPEHIFIPEYLIGLGVKEPTGIDQRQVNTWRGTSFNYEEFVLDAIVEFTVVTDFEFDPKDWAALWTSAQRNGLGTSRSQGYGTFTVERWDRL